MEISPLPKVNISIRDLEGLLSAIEFYTSARESATELDDETDRDMTGAGRCYEWVMKEIKRRKRRRKK